MEAIRLRGQDAHSWKVQDSDWHWPRRTAERSNPECSGNVGNAVPHRQPSHYVFPYEKCGARGGEDTFGFTSNVIFYGTDPTRPIGDWKEAWEKAKVRAATILKGNNGEAKKVAQKTESARPVVQPKDKSIQPKPESLKCRFHDLRHTAVTRLLEAGIPIL